MWRYTTKLRTSRTQPFPFRQRSLKFHTFPGSPGGSFVTVLALAVGTLGAIYTFNLEEELELLGSYAPKFRVQTRPGAKILANFFSGDDDVSNPRVPGQVNNYNHNLQISEEWDVDQIILESFLALEGLLSELEASESSGPSTDNPSAHHIHENQTKTTQNSEIPNPIHEIRDSPVSEIPSVPDLDSSPERSTPTPTDDVATAHTFETHSAPVSSLPNSNTPIQNAPTIIDTEPPEHISNPSPGFTENKINATATTETSSLNDPSRQPTNAHLYQVVISLQRQILEQQEKIDFFEKYFSDLRSQKEVLTRDANAFYEYMKLKEKDDLAQYQLVLDYQLNLLQKKLRREHRAKEKDIKNKIDNLRLALQRSIRNIQSMDESFKEIINSEATRILGETFARGGQEKDAQKRLLEIGESLRSYSDYLQRSRALHNLSLVLLNIIPVLDTMTPFPEQYRKLTLLAKGTELPVISEMISKIPADIPKNGIPSLTYLKASFVPCYKKGKIASTLPPNPSPLHVIYATTRQLLFPTPKGLADGNDPLSVIARAEYFLERDCLLESVKEIETLDDPVKKEFEVWLSHAKNRLLMHQFVETLRDQTLDLLNHLKDFDNAKR